MLIVCGFSVLWPGRNWGLRQPTELALIFFISRHCCGCLWFLIYSVSHMGCNQDHSQDGGGGASQPNKKFNVMDSEGVGLWLGQQQPTEQIMSDTEMFWLSWLSADGFLRSDHRLCAWTCSCNRCLSLGWGGKHAGFSGCGSVQIGPSSISVNMIGTRPCSTSGGSNLLPVKKKKKNLISCHS